MANETLTTRPVGKVAIYACGGGGINIAREFDGVPVVADIAKIRVTYLATSDPAPGSAPPMPMSAESETQLNAPVVKTRYKNKSELLTMTSSASSRPEDENLGIGANLAHVSV